MKTRSFQDDVFCINDHSKYPYCRFSFSVLCVFFCAWLWWIKTRLSLLFASNIGHNVIWKEETKRKMWSKKWYLKRNISCDAHLLDEFLEIECLEMMPSWCRQVNWGNCGIPWVNCSVLCVKYDWKGQFWGLRYCLSKLCSLLSFSVRYDVTQWNRSV